MSATMQLPAAPSGLDAATPPPPRRRRGRAAAKAAGIAAAGGIAWAVLGSPGEEPSTPAANSGVPTAITTVSRRDLVDREDVEGALNFAGQKNVAANAQGTLTRVRPEGSTVRRGQSLYSVDAKATGYVMYGRVPMYRALDSSVSNGRDVRQLERNLVALGYDPDKAIDVEGDWDAATTAAVVRWEKDRGVKRHGKVDRGEIVFSPGPVRVGEHKANVGDSVNAGAPVTAVTSRSRVIVARLAARRQGQVRSGQRVRVTLPDGREVAGRVTRVGRVAKAGEDGAEATVELRVALVGKRARRARLDQAPVTVSIATDTARNVLAVPVTALVATGGGRYAVEVVGAGGTRKLVRVTTGAFANGYVEVSGVAEGARVVVPQ